MPHPDTLPEGFTHWPHIRRITTAQAEAIAAQSEAGSDYDAAAALHAVLIGQSETHSYFLVNRPSTAEDFVSEFVCEAYGDLPEADRPFVLEAEYETTVEGETVTVRCKEADLGGETPVRSGLVPSWVAGLPLPETTPLP